jgi:hypothetical protein
MISDGRTRRPRRLNRLAHAMEECARPDIYFAQNDRFTQISTLVSEQTDHMSFAPEQLLMLARIESLDSINGRS